MGVGKRRKKRDKNNTEGARRGLREKMTEVLELPKEIVLNVPRLTLIGMSNLIIENYKGIIEYDSSRVRLNTSLGILKITGNGLVIKEITSEDVMVDGDIRSLEFQK